MTDLASPKVIVLLEQSGTDDLLEYTVQTDNRDAIQWDITRARKNWPQLSDGPMLWLTFVAWHALHRTGEYKGTLDEFLQITVEVRGVKRDGSAVEPSKLTVEDLAPLAPTDPAAESGS